MDDQNVVAPEGDVIEGGDQVVATPVEAAPEGDVAAA